MTGTSDKNEPVSWNDSTKSTWTPMRWAVLASIVFHITLIMVLLAWYFPRQAPADSRLMADQSDSPTSTPADNPAVNDAPPGNVPADNVPPEQIESSLRGAIESTATISEERKLSELQRNVQRLEQIASESSIAEVGQAIRSATALEDRASVPAAEPIGGAFDYDSAQFHDVSRIMNDDGKWVYRSILLDAKGRTIEVELTESEGKTAYDTMQMVKASPFAETVYRSMVMPMLDKMIPKTIPNSQLPVAPPSNPSAQVEDTP